MSIELAGDLLLSKKRIEQLEKCLRSAWQKTDDEEIKNLIEENFMREEIEKWQNDNS
ncbi:MAG: hypothetical protein UT24_C0019G0009 [Candidatus Woesebacteria bacterium GW2011_GWB1_39_12]|uniref:Uncharacterized protein n=1 Tax=Candidatus Woesebacteria bacterium GW2011_GWB1_39_12 TaxID=1618574 RepID=A0A0G0PP76_9BACT|nr:MAG: hypothetical protein UT24_C0019G0009 [Candidatus Woesebacteria bacterium GW2011_GWB1_39_12]